MRRTRHLAISHRTFKVWKSTLYGEKSKQYINIKNPIHVKNPAWAASPRQHRLCLTGTRCIPRSCPKQPNPQP